ncbi:hypothetical protein [Massilia sp. TWR1-2-2]|uniref:hypothetical protein n=1 Tax=Massilia sp. TWR1-2-2 TaxID=2804584 RepID=UPI003CF2A25F
MPAKTAAVLHSPCDGAKEVLPSDSDCSSDGATADVTSAAERINCLLQVTAERDLTFAQNQMLCGANEKLVLATIEAQTLRDEAEAANHRQNEVPVAEA